jgi:PKD repeat protein
VRRAGWLLVGVVGCGGGRTAPATHDAALDAFVLDDASPARDGAPLTSVDFTATGCALAEQPAGDGGLPTVTCTGPAALRVAFTGLAAAEVNTWAWTFGDGGASAEPAPVHTFALPGTYDVTVSAAGPGGTATAIRSGYVIVVPAALGAACADKAQCATGTCEANLCTSACASGTCATGACAQLGGPWAGARCVEACAVDGDCATGRRCQVLAGATGWLRGCVPGGVLGDLGEACVDATGAPDDSACASARCLGIGARGACALDCATAACPDGSACATFGNGTAACVPSCDGAHPCGDDPWLACEAAGAPGAWGFTLATGPGSACAPRSCTDASACAGGACTDDHCATP